MIPRLILDNPTVWKYEISLEYLSNYWRWMPVVPWEKIWLCVSSMSWSWAFRGKTSWITFSGLLTTVNSFVCSSRIQSLSLFFWSKLCLYQGMCQIFIPHLCISAKEPEAPGSEISWSNLFQIQIETLSNLDLLGSKACDLSHVLPSSKAECEKWFFFFFWETLVQGFVLLQLLWILRYYHWT